MKQTDLEKKITNFLQDWIDVKPKPGMTPDDFMKAFELGIKQLISDCVEEIIGEDDKYNYSDGESQAIVISSRNFLKSEIREKKKDLLG